MIRQWPMSLWMASAGVGDEAVGHVTVNGKCWCGWWGSGPRHCGRQVLLWVMRQWPTSLWTASACVGDDAVAHVTVDGQCSTGDVSMPSSLWVRQVAICSGSELPLKTVLAWLTRLQLLLMTAPRAGSHLTVQSLSWRTCQCCSYRQPTSHTGADQESV